MKSHLWKDLHQEICLEHRAYLESQLAVKIAQSMPLIPAVHKVSGQILKIIGDHRQTLTDIIKTSSVREELTNHKAVGHLEGEDPPLEMIESVLAQRHPSFVQVLYIHAVFIYRLYGPLVKILGGDAQRQHDEHVQAIFVNPLFQERGRILKEPNPLPTVRTGIVRNKVHQKRLPEIKAHSRALDQYAPDEASVFYQTLKRHGLPFVAGVSGHTGSLLLGAACYGEFGDHRTDPLSLESWQQYSIAVFAFLTLGGNHSFDESLCVAGQLGLPYQSGHYLYSLPFSMRHNKAFQELIAHFPEPILDQG